jgi:hypothetical protein
MSPGEELLDQLLGDGVLDEEALGQPLAEQPHQLPGRPLRRRVVRLALREAVLLLTLGLAMGTGLALWAGRAAGALLFGLKPCDPQTLAAAVVLLAVVALPVSYLPALRPSRLQPMSALRED